MLKKSLQITENSTLLLTLAPEECKMNKMKNHTFYRMQKNRKKLSLEVSYGRER